MKPNKWLVMGIVSLGTLMSGIGIGSLNVANPLISRTLGVGIEHVQWVSTIYLLVICSTMLLLGRIGDRVGGHKIYLAGLIVFVAGSLFSGLSLTFLLLLVGRALQAVGAAMLMATGMGLLMLTFPLEQRGTAMGINVLMVGVGGMAGPSLGGFLLTHFDWSMIFFANLPFGIVSLILGLLFLRLPKPEMPSRERLDIGGALLLAACTTSLILCLSGGFASSQWFGLLLVVLVPLFIFAERRHPSPLWDFALMANKRFSLGNLVTFLSYFANMFVGFLFPFFLEGAWDFPVGLTGLFMMIAPICMAVSAPIAGILSDRIGGLKLMPVALVVFICGLVLIVFWGQQPVYPLIICALALMGFGMGILNTPNNSDIMTAAGKRFAGYAGGFVGTNRNLAFCLGTAASAGLFTVLVQHFEASSSHSAAYVSSIHIVVIISILISVLSLVVCLWLKRIDDKSKAEVEK
jgi:EmrB/QacA subfamily drug resistance transporter